HWVFSNQSRGRAAHKQALKFAKRTYPAPPDEGDTLNRRFDLTRLVPSLLAAAAASKPWSDRALRDVTMFIAESAC
ncbi:transposase, partial [Xanthomonas oryzae pv. oryzae]